MHNVRHRVIQFFRVWRAARHERRLLLEILSKPSDRLLIDAGITREDALRLVRSDLRMPLWWHSSVPQCISQYAHRSWSDFDTIERLTTLTSPGGRSWQHNTSTKSMRR